MMGATEIPPGPRLPGGEDSGVGVSAQGTASRSGIVQRALSVLELVAATGGSTAKEIANATGLPVPTVYRIVRELLEAGYLVHLRSERRYELGYKLHQLSLSLHQQIGVPQAVQRELTALHRTLHCAAYLSIHRGPHAILAFTADSPDKPRVEPLAATFDEAAHATAFGKILLSTLTPPERKRLLGDEPLQKFTSATITSFADLEEELAQVEASGFAWDLEGLRAGVICAAATVLDVNGAIVGSVAVSGVQATYRTKPALVHKAVRETALRVSRYFRMGHTR